MICFQISRPASKYDFRRGDASTEQHASRCFRTSVDGTTSAVAFFFSDLQRFAFFSLLGGDLRASSPSSSGSGPAATDQGPVQWSFFRLITLSYAGIKAALGVLRIIDRNFSGMDYHDKVVMEDHVTAYKKPIG